MNYTFDVILSEDYRGRYILKVKKNGFVLNEFTATSHEEAMLKASAYMSSWTSVSLNWETEDEPTERS